MALQALLNLQFLFWFGWIVSLFLSVCFVVGLILEEVFRKEIFLDSSLDSKRHDLSVAPFSAYPIIISAALFTVAFVSRYWLSGLMFGPWYFSDETLESCINPFHLSQGEDLWGGYTNYLTYSIYLMAYRLFGFFGSGARVARATNIFFFATSLVILYWALQRALGKQVCWMVIGIMLISSPFITHSIFATPITFSLVPVATVLLILMRPLSQVSAGFLGPSLLAGLYLYPAAFITGVCLVFFHAIVCYRSWTGKTRSIFLVAFLFFAGLGYQMRTLLTGNPDWKQWAGGLLSFEHIAPHSMVVLKDTFWESSSWVALNHQAPYLDTVMLGFLAVGLGSSLIFSKVQPSVLDRKWVWISLLSFLGSVVLSALARDYTGVRRTFSSIPLLFLIAGLGLKYLWRWKGLRPLLVVTVIVCFGLVTLRSYVISQKDWPALRNWSRPPGFMHAVTEALLQSTHSQKSVVIVAYPSEDPYHALQYRCALSLDEKLNQYFQKARVIPQSELNRRHELGGEFVLFANEPFSDNRLQDIFGRPPTSSKIRKFSESPKPSELIAIYEFTSDSASSGNTGPMRSPNH